MWKQAQYLQMKENSVLSLQKYPSQGVRMKKEKELGPDRPYFQFVSYYLLHIKYFIYVFG